MDQETIQELRDKGRESLFFLARAILGFSDLDPEIHKPICRELEQFTVNTRMSVELPRTWFKSTLVSISYAIWRAINDPNIRILIAQNTHGNACKKLRAIAAIFEKNKLFQLLYPEILPDKNCRWSSESLELNRTAAHPEGTFEAAGVGTAAVSRHYDLIIEDDTISPKKDDMTGIVQQPTRADIEKAIGWHGLCHPMLLHPTKSQIVIVGTRWAERDLLGYIYDKFHEYKSIRRTAIEDENGEACGLSEDGVIESNGKLTWPARFDMEALLELLKTEGPYMFACLYLGKPTAAINQIFRRDWIQYSDSFPRGCYACTSVDLASAEAEESSDPDFNVILTTAIEPKSGKIYVLEMGRPVKIKDIQITGMDHARSPNSLAIAKITHKVTGSSEDHEISILESGRQGERVLFGINNFSIAKLSLTNTKIYYIWSIHLSQFMVSILIGIVFQLLWEDRPITEPL